MFVNIFSSFILFNVSFIILCPSSLAIEVAVYHLTYGGVPVYNGSSYGLYFYSDDKICIRFEVLDIKDNLHVALYRNDNLLDYSLGTLTNAKIFNFKSTTLLNIKLKICTKEHICISPTIVEGRRVSDATPLSEADRVCLNRVCEVIVSLTDVTTDQVRTYVLERNGINVSTSTASTTTREPVTSVLAATEQPETVAASESWTATIVTIAVTSAAVLLLALITVACIRLCRARTAGQPASDRFWNRFYVNLLLRDECNAEIRERERRDAEIRERERRDAELEYNYVYDHRYAPRTQRTR
ncbi:uncharacterized protein LOC124643628 [Helicoverpa zea]|uniref:uncharacterized protein LOC124643628 n=1 Tax=Helicoverpa zea TaxID=7113 RepID=UPI001F5968FF|nr:uncharacterized protein LOC124643628 [Helicoverpa zea]